jgi:hypothetical protein
MAKKKTNSLFLILLFIYPLLLMGGGLFYITRSSGFSIHKIISRLDYNKEWEIDAITDRQREMLIREVFPQTYYYLASGNQCYAFISEDRRYVLKFFKMQNLFPKEWVNNFPQLDFKKTHNKQLISERIFASYLDAYESLREETGLVYLHFNKSREFKSVVTLIDNKGKKHLLDLDTVEFVVQKRAQKIFDHFYDLLRGGNFEEIRSSIRSFLQLIALRCEKGFVDHDLSIRNNFGFVGTRAIQFDCATLTRDSSMKYPLNFRREVMQVAEHLDIWARDNCPEISLFIQEEAQRIINHFE